MATSVASVVSHFPSPQNGFTTTLASTIASGATTVPLNSVAGYTNAQIGVFVVDPTDSTKKQTFTGIIDTAGVQVTSVVWTAGTNQQHTAGSTVVDYATATHIAMITKGLLVEHAQTGIHALSSSSTITSSKFLTALNDTNGNELFKVTATASAVNEFTVANAATGNPPTLSVTGGDTNTDGYLVAKGTGSFRHAGPYDGWVAANETWTYVSATTFTTASAALAGTMQIGDRIKLTQTTVKYFYVVGISGTTITITGGTSYTLANAAITLPFYSHELSPVGFPQEFAYTMTETGFTATTPTRVSTFHVTGRRCHVSSTRSDNQTSNATTYTMTLPVTAATRAGMSWFGFAAGMSNSASAANPFRARIASAGTVITLGFDQTADGNFTAANNKGADVDIWYEI